ncbi:MAG: hypothetical protein ACAI34_23320 [Verrucomicrobium sp.]
MNFFVRPGLLPLLFACGFSASVAAAGPLAAPSYDDVPVLVCRLIVVESVSPLIEHGAQVTEESLAARMKTWRDQDAGSVVVDEGFLLPVGGGLVSPAFDSAGGQALQGAAGAFREPGVSLTIGAQVQGGLYSMQAAVSLWNLTGERVRDSLARIRQFRSPLAERPASGFATFRTCQQGKEVTLRWETGVQQGTALTGRLASGSQMYQSVIILPVATRSSFVAQPGQPAQYRGGSLRVIEGDVPTAVFWRVINHVRPDLARPAEFSGRMLDLYWADEKWDLFLKTLQQAGGRFKEIPGAVLSARAPVHRVVSSSMVLNWGLGAPLPTSSFTIAMEDPMALNPGAETGVQRWCESHDRRWTLFARPMGGTTQVVAVRSEFEGTVAAPPRAMAVAEDDVPAAPVPRAMPVPVPVSSGSGPAVALTPTAPAPAMTTGAASPSNLDAVPALSVPQLVPGSTPSSTAAATTAARPVAPVEKVPAKIAQARSPLNLYAGEWSGTLTGQPNSRAKMICNWNFDGTELMRDSSVVVDATKGSPSYVSMVMKYDELAGRYHSQVVTKDSSKSSVAEGTYVASTRTFIWTAVNSINGVIMVTLAAFPQDGVMEWTQTITDKEGNLISQGGGKNVRQRK